MDLQSNTALVVKVAEAVAAEVEEIVVQEEDISVAEIENGMRRFLHEVGRHSLQQVLSQSEARYPEAEKECPHCGAEATYQRRREASLISLFGKVYYRRHYYLCAHCRQGHFPLDQRLGLQPGCVSAGLAPLLALLGIQTSFAKSSDKLAEELLLVRVSDNTIRKETRQMGRLQMSVEQEKQAESQRRNLHRERAQAGPDVPKRLYGSLDGTIVPLEKEWRELKAGCWYRVETTKPPGAEDVVGEQPSLRATDLTYFCDITRAEDFSSLFWATGCHRQAHLAEELVFVADGAAWIWRLVERNFPDAIQIVDWYHAVEYLSPIAHVAFADTDAQEAWLAKAKQLLWEGRIRDLINGCHDLLDHPEAAEPAQTASTYFQNNRHRMDYARYRAEGYQIGSGPIESGCKQIASLRLKRPGARWTEAGARETAKARAAWLSGHWNELKARRRQVADLPLAV